jgi:hypothetical protein
MASSSEDREEVEARARFLKILSSPNTCFIGVYWQCYTGLTEPPVRVYSIVLLLLLLIYFKIGAIGFGVLKALS